jgi:hypothetical protein
MCLSHYTTLDSARHILTGMTLRLSIGSLLRANDPRETKYWHFNVDMDSTRDRQLLHERRISERIKQNIGTLSFALDCDGVSGYYKPRMWAQYAENHRGVCIVFNQEALLQCIHSRLNSIGDVYTGRIQYFSPEPRFRRDDLSDITRNDIINENFHHIEQEIFGNEEHRNFYLFSKNIDWRDEAEYRILFRKNHTIQVNTIYIPIQNAIRAVIFGVDSPCRSAVMNNELSEPCERCEMYNGIISICNENSIPIERVRWTNGVPESDLYPVVRNG